jgi:two-component system C4-dicarboxylate transport sensor histidine kinase DctB
LIEHRLKTLDVTLERHFPPDPILVEVRPNRLEQVMVSLLSNALDSCEEASLRAPRSRSIRLRLEVENGCAFISVEDEGAGLGETLPERVFEPFFSTKPTGRGLGLGLSISRGIMAEHGGTLQLDPVTGGGAVAKIRLPLARKEVPAS